MVLGFAPKEHATTLIENGTFGEDEAMLLSEVAAAYEHDVDVETVRLSVMVVKRTEVVPTDDGYEAYIASEVATSLADRLTGDASIPLVGYDPQCHALTLVQRGAFGEDEAMPLSEVAEAFSDDVDVETIRRAVGAIDRTTVTETADGYEAYIANLVAADLAGRLYNDSARVL